MIRKVILNRFKRYENQEFNLEGPVVLAGPNNSGKTTLLQAIASWNLALNRWRELHDYNPRQGYKLAPIARQAFFAVPLRDFKWMWNQKSYTRPITIEVQGTNEIRGMGLKNWSVTMELRPDSTEQIYVHPADNADPTVLANLNLGVTFVPPMTGLSIDEPVYQPPKLAQLLGLGRPGEIIRNLLVQAHSSPSWAELTETIQRLFGYELLPPDSRGADILVEYRPLRGGPSFDVSSAGSGFQQVLMLLTFLHSRPGSILLLDEPDAHLHVILQDAIYAELTSVAARRNSQLIIATHSEVIIDSVPPEELCVFMGTPRRLVDVGERSRLVQALGILTQVDLTLALTAKGILYVEGRTDIDILREWSRILGHRVYQWLSTQAFWRAIDGCDVTKAKTHHDALCLARENLPALVLLDGDANQNIPETNLTGTGLQRVRWRRYEIESYLFHPAALGRFTTHLHGVEENSPVAAESIRGMQEWIQNNLPPAVVQTPLGEHVFLKTTKARTEILPPILSAAGFPGIPYQRYSEIAALMRPDEIHPEVVEKLDAIATAIGL